MYLQPRSQRKLNSTFSCPIELLQVGNAHYKDLQIHTAEDEPTAFSLLLLLFGKPLNAQSDLFLLLFIFASIYPSKFTSEIEQEISVLNSTFLFCTTHT